MELTCAQVAIVQGVAIHVMELEEGNLYKVYYEETIICVYPITPRA